MKVIFKKLILTLFIVYLVATLFSTQYLFLDNPFEIVIDYYLITFPIVIYSIIPVMFTTIIFQGMFIRDKIKEIETAKINKYILLIGIVNCLIGIPSTLKLFSYSSV